MVNENNEQDFLVNSASLEDVVTNEPGEQRAQSVTSIHSSTDPPTPSYEDIHARLEASNRNIQNMKEQQQQLQRLQDQAKQHLAEMEALRDRTAAQQRTTQNGDMQFESMDDVHTNMSSLVGRMKNLTAFIQGQNELTNLLGDDGPDVLAEQQTLQQKLEDLKSHRDEMKNLILELHEVNSLSEKRANESKSQTQHDNRTQEEAVEQDSQARAVPMEYSRIVPIELVENQQHNKRHARPSRPDNNAMSNDSDAPQSSEDEIIEDPATIALLQQKMSDIQAMKNQLTRLKSMMETVKLIEDRTGGLDPRDIGYSDAGTKGPVEEVKQRSSPPKRESPPKNTNTQQRPYSSAVPFDKDRTPIPEDFATQLTNDPDINGKIEALNEVTRDLRSQATSLANERSRIRVLKEEIMRRKAGNAPAATSSNTPENKIFKKDGVSPLNQRNSNGDVDITKIQFDGKKKEFQNLCHHMQANENSADQRAEEDEEIEEDDESDNKQEKHAHKPATNYFASQPQNLSCMSSPRSSIAPTHMKESIDSVAAEANACIPCDVDSFKSSSSRSYSMPPPMRSINNRENTWRKTVPETYDHHANQNFSMPTGSSGIFPQAWNPYYFYNSQCSQHVTPVQNTGTDCNCSMNANPSGTSAPPGGSNQSFADPIILQQFAQTQQMLINSVCQCNQMLWHQQREINTISNALHTLQEQFQNHINNSDMTANIRSESVPPVSTVQNNLCLNQNRAHSEQPHQFSTPHPHYVHHSPPLMTPHAMNSTNFHRRNFCNFHQQQGTSSYNFAMEQQSAGSAFAAGVTAACNSMQHSYNNLSNGGTTFMHHHNNTLHPGQNNHSNLQNAAQQPQQGQQTTVTSNSQQVNVSSAGSNINGLALNNQVPPGNRANNYWDNFRR